MTESEGPAASDVATGRPEAAASRGGSSRSRNREDSTNPKAHSEWGLSKSPPRGPPFKLCRLADRGPGASWLAPSERIVAQRAARALERGGRPASKSAEALRLRHRP